jgi:hypothetical protein
MALALVALYTLQKHFPICLWYSYLFETEGQMRLKRLDQLKTKLISSTVEPGPFQLEA